jgi:hypothetical protein
MNRIPGPSRPFSGLSPAGQLGAGLPGSRVPLRLAHPERSRPRPPHQPPVVPQSSVAAEVDASQIRFHQLTSPYDIARVLHLRREIQLNVADAASFAALEKKEMRPALSALSSGEDNSSVPSAWCRWGRASPHARRSWTTPK